MYTVSKHFNGYILNFEGIFYPCKDAYCLWLKLKQLGLKE